MTTTDRINEILRDRGISINSLARGNTSLQRKLNRQLSEGSALTADIVNVVLEHIPDIDPMWVLTGEDRPMADPNTIPLIPDMAVGGLPDGVDISGYKETDCPRCVSPEPSADFAIDVTGDSMSPDYPSGCRVYLSTDTSRRPIRYGEVYVLDTAEGILLKRVFEASTPDHLRLVSINAEYPPYNFPKSEIRGLYRVISRLIKQ